MRARRDKEGERGRKVMIEGESKERKRERERVEEKKGKEESI